MKNLFEQLRAQTDSAHSIIREESENNAKAIAFKILQLRHLCLRSKFAEQKLDSFVGFVLTSLDEIAAEVINGETGAGVVTYESFETINTAQAEIENHFDKVSGLPTHALSDPLVREKVWGLTDGHCAYCGAELSKYREGHGFNFNIEHVVPKSCGGPDHITNYVPACHGCNTSKGSGHVLEFIQRARIRLVKNEDAA